MVDVVDTRCAQLGGHVELSLNSGRSWAITFEDDPHGMKFVKADLEGDERLVFLPACKTLMVVGPVGATGVWFGVISLNLMMP